MGSPTPNMKSGELPKCSRASQGARRDPLLESYNARALELARIENR